MSGASPARLEIENSPVLCLEAQGLGLRQFRRVNDLEVDVSEEDKLSPYERHDAIVLGLSRAVKTLAAVVYADTPHREWMEEELRTALAEEKPDSVPSSKLNLYRAAIQGVITAIEDVKRNSG